MGLEAVAVSWWPDALLRHVVLVWVELWVVPCVQQYAVVAVRVGCGGRRERVGGVAAASCRVATAAASCASWLSVEEQFSAVLRAWGVTLEVALATGLVW